MGYLHYGHEQFTFDDRLLAHLQVVFTTKLRRQEPFFLIWTTDHRAGSGRHAIWINPALPMHLEYQGNRMPAVNREWVETLTLAANSTIGLVITKEGAVRDDVKSEIA